MELVEKSRGITSIECHLIGAGPAKQKLMDYCTAKGMKQVFFHPAVSKTGIADTALKTDAFVLCGRNLPSLYKYGIGMNKIPDYLAMGRPVIMAMEAANNPVAEAHAGICIGPECPGELADAIIMMAGMSEEKLQEMGYKGRKYAEKIYDMNVLAAQLAGVLDSV